MKNLSAFNCRQIRGALALAGLVWVVAAACAPSAQAQTYSPLYRFAGATKDGENPEAGLAMDTLGNFYGTNSLGMVFELTPTGARTILHRFRGAPSGCGTTGQPACDGANPYGGLLRNAANGFYGTTSAGGASNMGTVFVVASAGEKLLHSFRVMEHFPTPA